jgi:hypothetical protein
MPPALQNRPEEDMTADFVLRAFSFLSHYRAPSESGISPLFFKDIVAYAHMVGYTASDDILFFARLVNVCDTAHMKKLSDKINSQRKSKPKGGRRG